MCKKIKQGLAAGLIALAPALTGCLLSHTRIIPKARRPDIVMSASLDTLALQLAKRFEGIDTFNASVEMSRITGGPMTGKETRSVNFKGYILMRKPQYLRVIGLVPVLGSQAFDMVSDGENFKLLIPYYNKAIVGRNSSTTRSENSLYNLRPDMFFDSMFIQGPEQNQIITMTTDIRIVESGKKKQDRIIEPAYALQILNKPDGQTARTVRVIHISSSDLLPYQQDIYDKDGQVVTKAYYSNYQAYGNIPFPTNIRIERPRDGFSLTVTITKLTLNGHMDDDQFELVIPANIPVETLK